MPCRSCGNAALEMILSLGQIPLANALLAPNDLDQPEERFALDLVFCPACALVQILEAVPPQRLFRDYLYFSSFSETMLRYAQEHARWLIKTEGLGPPSLALEIASNDGYLLQYFQQAGVPVLGVEPARNIAQAAQAKGIKTIAEFFSPELASTLPKADVVIANNVLAHVPDPNELVAGIKLVLKPEGVATIEVPYVREMVENAEFDTIYHEHLSYFSITALDPIFSRNGLILDNVEFISLHGGSLRLFVRHHKRDRVSVENVLKDEQGWGVRHFQTYSRMVDRVLNLKSSLCSLLRQLKQEGKTIAGYGAAAKATILLNFFGIGPEIVSFVADRSPHKQGRFIPGVRIPIVAVERIVETQPDYLLVLAWNIADEIIRQNDQYRRRGGKFIIPIPEVRIV
jgi:SAM-dependent methyltransferase